MSYGSHCVQNINKAFIKEKHTHTHTYTHSDILYNQAQLEDRKYHKVFTITLGLCDKYPQCFSSLVLTYISNLQ